jgi:hypothetical protein
VLESVLNPPYSSQATYLGRKQDVLAGPRALWRGVWFECFLPKGFQFGTKAYRERYYLPWQPSPAHTLKYAATTRSLTPFSNTFACNPQPSFSNTLTVPSLQLIQQIPTQVLPFHAHTLPKQV